MSRKTLNTTNLEQLGAERLAALVMDLAQGSAALQRRARMELSAAQGHKDVAADIRKRFAALRRSTSYLDGRRQKALVRDLGGLLAMIHSAVAPQDADEAFELLWSLLQLAPSIHARTDDSNGAISDAMAQAVEMIATLSPRITAAPEALAERILDATADAGYGEFDGIIPALADALGPVGLEHLKKITGVWAAAPPGPHEWASYDGIGLRALGADSARRYRQQTGSAILADVADAQGDVDAYMARYSAEQLTYGTIAPDVARRLLDAGRTAEALEIVTRARAADEAKSSGIFRYDLDEVYEECLATLGRHDDLAQHLWQTFRQTLRARSLRAYLKLLPEFDDIEAEEKALDLAEAHPHLGGAISFLVGWPRLDRAARMITARADELDGNAYETLTAAADALDAGYPLAATLVRRAMIEDALNGSKSKRYRYAARHLAECQSGDAAIADYGNVPDHDQFVATLRQKHGRKYGFWQLVEG
ncbi:MAG: DUF6880 family protein [Paracoccus sp. (in: a-proteobacteria)]